MADWWDSLVDVVTESDWGWDDAISAIGTVANVASNVADVVGSTALPVNEYLDSLALYNTGKTKNLEYEESARAYDFRRTVSLQNSDIAEQNRIYEQQLDGIITERMRRQNIRTIESGKALFAASGVAAGGSTYDVISDMASEGALNVAIQNFESAQRQKGFAIQRDAAVKEADEFLRAAGQSRKNATTVLEDAKAARDLKQGSALAAGAKALPGIIGSIGNLLSNKPAVA